MLSTPGVHSGGRRPGVRELSITGLLCLRGPLLLELHDETHFVSSQKTSLGGEEVGGGVQLFQFRSCEHVFEWRCGEVRQLHTSTSAFRRLLHTLATSTIHVRQPLIFDDSYTSATRHAPSHPPRPHQQHKHSLFTAR